MSHPANDRAYDAIQEWLADMGCELGDIMQGEDGKFYVLVEGENGMEKAYMPEKFQALYDMTIKK